MSSHLGLSGSTHTLLRITTLNSNCIPSGNLHCASLPNPAKTSVMRFDSTNPPTLTVISLTTALPFSSDLLHSTCQTGAVAVFPPFPIPAIKRPTTSHVISFAIVWTKIPIVMITVKISSIHRRPSFSPMKEDMIAPAQHPRSYMDVTKPSKEGEGSEK
jgi:hypothetical protein